MHAEMVLRAMEAALVIMDVAIALMTTIALMIAAISRYCCAIRENATCLSTHVHYAKSAADQGRRTFYVIIPKTWKWHTADG